MQFGKELIEFQLIQHRLVAMLQELVGMQLYCMRLAQLETTGRMTDTIAVAGEAEQHHARPARS